MDTEREITQMMMDLTLPTFTGTLTYFCADFAFMLEVAPKTEGCRQREERRAAL